MEGGCCEPVETPKNGFMIEKKVRIKIVAKILCDGSEKIKWDYDWVLMWPEVYQNTRSKIKENKVCQNLGF